MPERANALERVRLGDAGILIISPEQLRSVSLRRVLDQREIGSWVLDEAHCLSRWGHDFRPDYRYVGRFIREKAGQDPIPPVLCLTATAKPDVKEEIADYFRQELGIELRVFDGGAGRTNLDFVVVPTRGSAKFDDVYQLLQEDLPDHVPGGAIIYCATARTTQSGVQQDPSQGGRADVDAFPFAQQFAQVGIVDSLVSSAGQMHHVGDHRLARGVDRSAATVAVCQDRCSFLPVGGRDAAGVACSDTHQLGRLIQCNLLRQQAVQNLKSRLLFRGQSHILHSVNVTFLLAI